MIDDPAELLRIGRKLQVGQAALPRPFGRLTTTTIADAKHDDPDPTVLGARDEQVGGERFDLSIGDDDEQGDEPIQRVLGTL